MTDPERDTPEEDGPPIDERTARHLWLLAGGAMPDGSLMDMAAYLDGRLDARARAAFELRLESDKTLARLVRESQAGSIVDFQVVRPPKNPPAADQAVRPWAIAASILAAAIIGYAAGQSGLATALTGQVAEAPYESLVDELFDIQAPPIPDDA